MNSAVSCAAITPADPAPPRLLHVPEPVLTQAMRWGWRSYPAESCGLLIGRRSSDSVTIHRMIPCENLCAPEERHRTFTIEPLELLAAEDEALATGEELLGLVHSHCDSAARPSNTDCDSARLWPDMLWLILSISAREKNDVAAWWPTRQGLVELPLAVPAPATVLWSANS